MSTVNDITTVDWSGDLRVDALLQIGAAWNYLLPARTTLYYTFDVSEASGYADAATTAFNASQRAAASAILSYASSVTGITFAPVASGSSADIHFGATNLSGGSTAGETISAWSYSNSGTTLVTYAADAYVFLDNVDFLADNDAPAAGGLGYEILLHEIGHALGLGHPFDNPYPLPDAQDNTNNTVMSYTDAGSYKSAFQSYDLLALRWIYGGDGLGGAWGANSVNGPSLSSSPTPTPTPTPTPVPAPTPTDDHGATTSTAGALSIGGSAAGSIETGGDRDWYAVSLKAGQRYVFTLEGAPTADGTLADPKLRLVSSSGLVLASNDDDGTSLNARIAYVASTTGTVYLEASSATSGGTGTYRVGAVQEAANRAPVAVSDAFATNEDTAVAGNLLANDSDPDGQALTAFVVASTLHGTLKLQPNGTFSYTPLANWSGTDAFSYGVTDGTLSATARVTLTVAAVNDAPSAVTTTLAATEDTVLAGRLPAGVDPDGDALDYATHTAPARGSVTIAADGRYTYTPQPDFSGVDSFVYRVSDGTASSTATISVQVAAVNDAPVATNLAITVTGDTPRSGMLPAAFDADGDAVTFAATTAPANGSVTIASNGQYTYVPRTGFDGADAFGFRVADGRGAANDYTASVSVVRVDAPPLGTDGPDTLVDTSGSARLAGLAGDDVLRGGSGDDALDGGPGTDVAAYGGAAAGYVVAKTGSLWRVSDLDGGDGTDTLSGIERLQFADRGFELVDPPGGMPGYGVSDHFLFDAVFYLLDHPELVPAQTLSSAWSHYRDAGAAQGHAPNAWFDASYYEARWADLAPMHLDDATLFAHFNLFGVWEGRSPGPSFDRFDGDRYLAQNTDVAAYVDAHIDSFLGSRSNGAIAHYLLYGADEQRSAYDLAGAPIRVDYAIDLGG